MNRTSRCGSRLFFYHYFFAVLDIETLCVGLAVEFPTVDAVPLSVLTLSWANTDRLHANKSSIIKICIFIIWLAICFFLLQRYKIFYKNTKKKKKIFLFRAWKIYAKVESNAKYSELFGSLGDMIFSNYSCCVKKGCYKKSPTSYADAGEIYH